MPFLRPATNNYFGFMPAGEIKRMTPYPVSSSEAGNIAIGDVVVLTSRGTAKVAPAGALASLMLGVAANSVTAGAGSTSARIGDPTASCFVYDHPDQMFVGCDTTSSPIVFAGSTNSPSIGQTYAVLTTGCTGSTGVGPSGQSVMALSGTVSTYGAATGVFKLVGPHPIEAANFSTGIFSSAGATSHKWLLVPATPQMAGWLASPVSTG